MAIKPPSPKPNSPVGNDDDCDVVDELSAFVEKASTAAITFWTSKPMIWRPWKDTVEQAMTLLKETAPIWSGVQGYVPSGKLHDVATRDGADWYTLV